MGNETKYARLEEQGRTELYMAGVSLDAIAADARIISPNMQVIPIDKTEIPDSYNWSIQKVERIPDWRRNGTYLLIRNFETYGSSFEKLYRQIIFN